MFFYKNVGQYVGYQWQNPLILQILIGSMIQEIVKKSDFQKGGPYDFSRGAEKTEKYPAFLEKSMKNRVERN